MKLLKPYAEYAESYFGVPSGRTHFAMRDFFNRNCCFVFEKYRLLDAFGREFYSFADGYSISGNQYRTIEAAKAAGIALAQSYGYIVAETDEEAEKIALLV
jgi:hypothetical protein